MLEKIRKPFNYTFKNATLILIIINVAVYFLFSSTSFERYEYYFSLNVIGFIYEKMYWQVLTYMFMHGGWVHLLLNMFALLIFGVQIERAIGTKEFVLMYLVIGVLSGLFSVFFYYFLGLYQASQTGFPLLELLNAGFYPNAFVTSLVGASGAIYGIMFAYAAFFPRSVLHIYGIIPVPAPILVLIYTLFEFFSQFFSASNVAHQTHLAGFFFAFLYILVRMGINPIKIWIDIFRRK